MSYMKLLKLLYLVDREALLRWGRPVSTDRYVSMDRGPVLSKTLDLINEGAEDNIGRIWAKYISSPLGDHEVELVQPDPPNDELSRAEEKLITEIFEKLVHPARTPQHRTSPTLPSDLLRMLKPGDAVLMPKYADATPHMWIVLTAPDGNSNIVIVNVTSLKNHPDQTTILKVGDHTYIKHDSVVLYADARIVSATHIIDGLNLKTPLFRQLDPCSDDLLKRICNGIFASDFTPNKVIDFCAKQWN